MKNTVTSTITRARPIKTMADLKALDYELASTLLSHFSDRLSLPALDLLGLVINDLTTRYITVDPKLLKTPQMQELYLQGELHLFQERGLAGRIQTGWMNPDHYDLLAQLLETATQFDGAPRLDWLYRQFYDQI